MLGPDGISDFEGLHGGRCNEEVRLYAFDLLSDDGVDMRDETLQICKLWLGNLLTRSTDGILHNDYHHDAGAIGPLLIRQACLMGLEGSCRSIGTVRIRQVNRGTGSRSRIRSRRP